MMEDSPSPDAEHAEPQRAGAHDEPYLASLAESQASPTSEHRGAADDDFVPSTDESAREHHSPVASWSLERHRARPPVVGRRRGLPLILLLLTIVSTFWVGASHWSPLIAVRCFQVQDGMISGIDLTTVRTAFAAHWQDGLLYSACVLGILLTHEMGHFLATVYYRIPASYPFCIPFPISPIGTMGAVIAMDGRQADRKELFDIGLAGPLAGLLVAIPVMWVGIQRLDLTEPALVSSYRLESPLGVRVVLDRVKPPGYESGQMIPITQLNPFFMAGWVGLLITGLNMLPVSQLDGGHVIYALLGKKAHWIARGVVVLAVAWSAYNAQPMWVLMIALVLLIGTDHPPTRDDNAPLGWFRVGLGVVSLIIPILCFSPTALSTGMGG